MPLRVANLVALDDGDDRPVIEAALRKAGVDPSEAEAIEIVRRSEDRRGGRTRTRCVVEIRLKEEPLAPPTSRDPDVRYFSPEPPRTPPIGDEPLPHPPVVVGAGPAGLFAALELSRRGYRPIVLERGDAMNARAGKIRDLNRDGVLDPESNYLFGEGGAGTWSDGKLTSRSKDPRAKEVLDAFARYSGVDAVARHYRPHLGSDRIRAVVGRMRREILALGGEILFRTRVEAIRIRDGVVVAIRTTAGEIPTREAILAPGHSARAFFRRLFQDGVRVERKPFQTGFRVEHRQEIVDAAVYGKGARGERPPADYRLSIDVGGVDLFSFCMCPGGEIIPAIHDLSHMNTNGMSYSKKDSGFANSGVVATLHPTDFGGRPEDPFAGVELQERYERLAAEAVGGTTRIPATRLSDFLAGRATGELPPGSCRTGFVPADVASFAPPIVAKALREGAAALARQLRGFLAEDATLVGPESRSSSPIRLPRDPETGEAEGVLGLRPAGEGAGYAGGIVSAAVDGLRAAEGLMARFGPPRAQTRAETT